MLALVILGGYGLLAYLVLPEFWTHYEHQRGLASIPMVTRTAQGIPGDPMNVGLIGDVADVVCAMHAAGWYPADRITLKSSIEIVGSVLLDRPYRDAPVSNLYYLGRREDLAYEKPIGTSADRRNHVRYWKVLESGEEKRPVSYRRSRRRGQHIHRRRDPPYQPRSRRRALAAGGRPGKRRHGRGEISGHRHRADDCRP
jgi:hypothetical protein